MVLVLKYKYVYIESKYLGNVFKQIFIKI